MLPMSDERRENIMIVLFVLMYVYSFWPMDGWMDASFMESIDTTIQRERRISLLSNGAMATPRWGLDFGLHFILRSRELIQYVSCVSKDFKNETNRIGSRILRCTFFCTRLPCNLHRTVWYCTKSSTIVIAPLPNEERRRTQERSSLCYIVPKEGLDVVQLVGSTTVLS